MADTYENIKGKIILHAQESYIFSAISRRHLLSVCTHIQVTAQEGQAEKVESSLKAIQAYSTSDKEPGCLTYRVCRSGNEFFIFEEYANGGAIQEHFETEGFKNLVSEVGKGTLVVGGPRITYYEEV
ncbi:unnamed protein product [Rhizoctonia solani]|uniref:ABM domain-containing protein n=1 Tax=Rhizoctonia solani TaxID=456999 RepID=A0A8H3H9M2_9AGAM|nr:unnamed protein product [Rhizoctonia solani]